jgi:hypothetical protein
MNVSVSVPDIDPSVLRELPDDNTDAKGATEAAKATEDEARNESADSADSVKKDLRCSACR